MTDDDDPAFDHQNAAIDLVDAFADHDTAGLAQLSPDERAEQLRSRRALYAYVDQLWECAKIQGLDPASRAEWNVVAGLRDLTHALVAQASEAQLAHDPDQ